LESVGKIPDQGDFTLRLKHYAANARPLLHIILLFAPALATACLVGRKPARSLAIMFAFAIESAQLAFGFGFDWVDVFDLASDAVGIALALVAHSHLKPKFPHWIAS
jgi:glycopeptide antibiotics resistance protein